MSGYVIHETPKVVVIATGLGAKSTNRKTGGMVQTWILVKAFDPIEAVRTGADKHVCGTCPLRGRDGKERACYVNLGRGGPLQVWRAWRNGRYPTLTDVSVFAGRAVRFGSYGEPVLIPLEMVKKIAACASGYTGYTHMWSSPGYQDYKPFFMASTTARDYQAAQRAGWRTFTVSADDLPGQITCPASAEAGHRTTCDKCKLCGGASVKAKSIQIKPHGSGAKYA